MDSWISSPWGSNASPRVLWGLTAFAFTGLAAAGCAEVPQCEIPPLSPALVEVREGAFLGETGPFIPRGVNSYPLLEHAGRGRFDAVVEILDQAKALGRPVVRTGAHMIGGQNPARLREADGRLREEGMVFLDRLLATAEAKDIQLILITSNHWSDYGGAPAVLRAVAPGEELPREAFYRDPRAVAHQVEYLRSLVTRTNTVTGRSYAEDSTVFAWELTNEARCDSELLCERDTLANWARTMAAAVREAGATQPIAWGGQGFLDQNGEDLAQIAAIPDIDILTVHVYPDHLGAQSFVLGEGVDRIPAGIRFGVNWIQDAASLARESKKALLIEEAGWRSTSDEERALVLGAWARAARVEGAGYLPWMIAESGRPDYDGYLIRIDEDPFTAGVLRCE